MASYKYVILGGGVAAGYAAQAFVEEGGQAGELCIVSAETTPPYERPPLSKDFLAGEEAVEDILINEPGFYDENGIDLRLETVVGRVDLARKQLYTSDGVIDFDKLMITTGSRVRKFDLPGADREGIFYLRQVEDSQRIRQAARDAEQVVVIGGSFIGMEVASVLQQRGVQTTMVFPGERVWRAFFTPQMSAFFQDYYRQRGVNFITGAEIDSFTGQNGRVSAVVLKSGQELPADMVVAGIGVVPNTELFAQSDVEIDDGIVVDEFLQTAVPDVFAAGDVVRYPDSLLGGTRRIEHWDNAVTQGQHAARAMLSEPEKFAHVPYFFSDMFDLSYEFWGDTAGTDKAVHRGDLNGGSFSVWWLQDGRLRAAFVMDRPDEERELAPRWIKAEMEVSTEDLANEGRPLKPVMDENATPG
jgi:NADPH-dependent 2,4-dienoyl-CoA reductase/sulfur reductase-like enzyme